MHVSISDHFLYNCFSLRYCITPNLIQGSNVTRYLGYLVMMISSLHIFIVNSSFGCVCPDF